MEDEIDDFFDRHSQWMARTHNLITPRLLESQALDLATPTLSDFFITKAPEFESPLDRLTSATTDLASTGNLLYNINAPFLQPAGLQKSLDLLKQDWTEGWDQLQKYSKEFGQVSK